MHDFFRSWESAGQRDLKQVIDAQLVHSIDLVYEVRGSTVDMSHALELQNVMDTAVYDFFGVQRPGRAVYYKLTTTL